MWRLVERITFFRFKYCIYSVLILYRMELDPYQILQVDYDATLDEVRTSFKQLVLKNHPDRGGDPQIFNIIKGAYSYIFQKLKDEKKLRKRENISVEKYVEDRQHNHLQNPKNTLTQNLDVHQNPDDTIINPNNFDVKNFNSLFGKYRADDPNDQGYGNDMDTSSKHREEVNNLATHDRKNKFEKKELTIYEEPNPISSLKENYKELGEEHVTNFTNKNRNRMRYTDYKQAYSEEEKITSDTPNVRNKDYRSIDDLLSERSSVSHKMSAEDEMKVNMKKKENEKMEKQREWRLHQNDEQVFDNYQQMQNLIRL